MGARPVPPGPKWTGPGGTLRRYEVDRLDFLVSTRNRYGDLVSFDSRTTIVNSAETAAEVLQCRSLRIRESFLQTQLTEHDMARALEMRRLLAPLLRRSQVTSGLRDALCLTRAVVEQRLACRPTAAWDPLGDLEGVMSKIVASLYFGHDGHALPQLVGELLDALSEVIGNPFALPASWPVPSRMRIRRAHRELQAMILPLLGARKRDPAQYGDVAGVLMAACQGRVTDQRRIADLLIGSPLAAHRVPAAAAGWMLMLVAGELDLLSDLRAEAARADSATGTLSVNSFPLALAVVKESLRLYPATWILSRFAVEPLHLGSYTFPRGHNFLVSPYVLHRDERYYPEASAFRPERWVDGTGATRSAPYLPFGRGLHGCPGRDLAFGLLVGVVLGVASSAELRNGAGAIRPDTRTTLTPVGLAFGLGPIRSGDRNGERQPTAPWLRGSRPWLNLSHAACRDTPKALPISAQDSFLSRSNATH